MAGGKETPRQKMIGMMYLVLTAMLALNVSKEIINAFVTQDNQMLVNNNNLVEGINGFMAKFSALEIDHKSKQSYLKWKPKIFKVNTLSNKVDDYLLENLNQLMEESEDEKNWFSKNEETQFTNWQELELINKKEDYDIASRLFGGDKSTKGYKKGGEIRMKLIKLRDSLLIEMGNFNKGRLEYSLKKEWLENTEILQKKLTEINHPDKLKLLTIYNTLSQKKTLKNHGKEEEWQLVKFDHQPIVGAIGVFTELRNQVRMAQHKALEIAAGNMEEPMLKINKIEPQIITSTSYLNQGDTLGVRVGIIAYDSTAVYPIKYKIGSQEFNSSNNNFTIKGNSVGDQKVSGVLELDLADGKKEFPWSFEYKVGKPLGTISSPAYNVLYADNYENIIEASFSGYSSSDVQVICPQCLSINKRNNQYVLKVRRGTEPVVILRAKGAIMKRKYKVKSLPKPVLYFCNKTSGSLSKGDRSNGKILKLKIPESSVLGVNYEVTSFKMDINTNSKGSIDFPKSTTRNLTKLMRKSVKRMTRGEKVTFYNIKYRIKGSSKSKSLDLGVTFKAV